MDDVERDLIIETLSHTLGNRTHAATILGISIRALRNKLHDYAAQGVAVPPPTAGVAAGVTVSLRHDQEHPPRVMPAHRSGPIAGEGRHPRLCLRHEGRSWMAGLRPAMTVDGASGMPLSQAP